MLGQTNRNTDWNTGLVSDEVKPVTHSTQSQVMVYRLRVSPASLVQQVPLMNYISITEGEKHHTYIKQCKHNRNFPSTQTDKGYKWTDRWIDRKTIERQTINRKTDKLSRIHFGFVLCFVHVYALKLHFINCSPVIKCLVLPLTLFFFFALFLPRSLSPL